MKPDFPLISIYKNVGLEIFSDKNILPKMTSVYTIISQRPNDCKIYDIKGQLWNCTFVNDKVKNNFKTRLLANTIYNPFFDVDIVWEALGNYEMIDLKNAISICFDKDDDVITQFVDRDFIKSQIIKCNTFYEIIFILNKYVFEVDEEKL